MRINGSNQTSFKSNIKIVAPNQFQKIVQSMEKEDGYDAIFQWEIVPDFVKFKQFKSYRTDAQLVSTEGIRSCTGGVVANRGKNASLAMHIGDTETNLKNINILEPYIRGTNAILIGSKSQFEHSPVVYRKIKNMIQRNKIPLTEFRRLQLRMEANYAYDSQSDTLFLSINDIQNPNIFVKTMQELKSAFRHVKISRKDTIEFLTTQPPSYFRNLKKVIPNIK